MGEADDDFDVGLSEQLDALAHENDQLKSRIAILTERNNALMEERNLAIREADRLRTKLKILEKK